MKEATKPPARKGSKDGKEREGSAAEGFSNATDEEATSLAVLADYDILCGRGGL
jgi:hypothetical protein